MNDRVCKKCGKIFAPKSGSEIICPECREKRTKNSVYKTCTCAICGRQYRGTIRSKYCQECRLNVNRNRAAMAEKNGPKRHLGDTDYCVACGKPYIVVGGLQKYCPECKDRETKKAKDEEKRRWNEEHPIADRQKKRTRERICAVCGKPYTLPGNRVTCSPECAEIRKKWTQLQINYRRGHSKTPPPPEYQPTKRTKKTED